MSRFGRCCICTVSFKTTGVCSLRCGHTYHEECINEWIKNSKTCPNCRKKTIARDIVKLFFDDPDISFTQTPTDFQDNASSEKMINELTSSLATEKENMNNLLNSFEICQKELKFLKNQLKLEKKKSATLILKDERIKGLENLLRNQSEMEGELKMWKARVKASEFFRYLIKKNEEGNEDSIDQFLTTAGDIDQKKFFEIILKQRKNLEKQLQDLNFEINALQKEISEKTNKNKKYKRLIVDLKSENDNLKEKWKFSNNAQEPLLNTSTFSNESLARPKKSFGFGFAEDTLDSSALLRSAKRTAFLENVPLTSNDTVNDLKVALNFGDMFSDEEENENNMPAWLHCGKKNNLNVEENFLENNIKFDDPVTHSLSDNKIKSKKDVIIPKRKLLCRPSAFNRSIAILDDIDALEGTSCSFLNNKNNQTTRKKVKKTKKSSPSYPVEITQCLSDQFLAGSSDNLSARFKLTKNQVMNHNNSVKMSKSVTPESHLAYNNSIEVIELD